MRFSDSERLVGRTADRLAIRGELSSGSMRRRRMFEERHQKTGTVLGQRRLNRSLLQRQDLLRRRTATIRNVAEHLVGLQAQASMPPYLGLFARIEGFRGEELGRMLTEREVVRLTLMRGTIHLVTVEDALFLRPLLQESLERRCVPVRRRIGEAAFARLGDVVREILDREALSARELATRLVGRGIGQDVLSLTQTIPAFVPLVQLPPRGVWGAGGQVKYATLESWTGRELRAEVSLDELVLRYLGAFGPATVMDMQNWSGLTRLKTVFERLCPTLVTFRDEKGRELFDLPDAPRPALDKPAPVRFLGEYDNILLGHRDRSRIIPEDFPWSEMLAPGRFVNNLLVDGVLRATWWIERDEDGRSILGVRPFRNLSTEEREAVTAEAQQVLAFVAGDAGSEVRFESAVR